VQRERWERLERLFAQGLTLPQAERAAWLARASGDDAELRREVEELLRADAAQGVLDTPPLAADGAEAAAIAPSLAAGTRIGAWRIEKLVGRGGMGEVYAAMRAETEFSQRGALKLLRFEAIGELARFHAERQILARLDHTGIARLLDGGVAPDGRPYTVMEFVEGISLIEHCNARRATLHERLDLFVQVCDAVAYAHRNLVIHRDLKPANTLVDAEGKVKLLDFGIAKLIDASASSSAADPTMTIAPFTLDYAAPEQLVGEPVTTATDVYALGVLLFELLTGERPLRKTGLPSTQALALLDREAPQPSRTVRDKVDAPVPANALAGDLDAIVGKCLRRESAHRYDTVNGVKLDLQRHRAHEPVLARDGARMYVFGRVLRRYRWAIAAAAALIVALAAGLAGTLWQSRRAESEAHRANAVKDFLLGVFQASDPRIASDKPRGQITARELLDISAGRIDQRFADDPDTRIDLLRTAADIYRELNEGAAADKLEERELDLTRQHYGPYHPNVLDAAVQAAQRACAAQTRTLQDCAKAQAAAEALLDAAHDSDAPRRGIWWNNEGRRLQVDDAQQSAAEAAFTSADAIFEAGAPLARSHVTALLELGNFQQRQGRIDESIATLRRGLGLVEKLPEHDDAKLVSLWGSLGLTLQQAGRYSEAASAFAYSADYAERTSGADSREALFQRGYAARTAHLAGEREKAWREYARLMPNLQPLDKLDHYTVLIRLFHGDRLSAEGRAAEAIPELEAVARYQQAERTDAQGYRQARRFLGEAYLRAQRRDDARRELKASLDDYLAHQQDSDQATMAARESYGRLLLEEGEPAAAKEQFAAVVGAAADRKLAHVALAHGGLARAALTLGDHDLAQRESATALSIWNEVTGFRDMRMGPYLQRIRADVLAASGDFDGAQQIEDQAAALSVRYDDPSSPTTQRRDLHRLAAK